MKILIVEDEPKTGDYLKQGLSEAGLLADLARDGVVTQQQAAGPGIGGDLADLRPLAKVFDQPGEARGVAQKRVTQA